MSVAPRLSVLSTLAAGLVLLAGCAKDSGYPNFVDIVERASPSVVNISTVSRVDAGMARDMPEFAPLPFEAPGGSDAPMEDMESLGSGFVLWSDGYIVTNRPRRASATANTCASVNGCWRSVRRSVSTIP